MTQIPNTKHKSIVSILFALLCLGHIEVCANPLWGGDKKKEKQTMTSVMLRSKDALLSNQMKIAGGGMLLLGILGYAGYTMYTKESNIEPPKEDKDKEQLITKKEEKLNVIIEHYCEQITGLFLEKTIHNGTIVQGLAYGCNHLIDSFRVGAFANKRIRSQLAYEMVIELAERYTTNVKTKQKKSDINIFTELFRPFLLNLGKNKQEISTEKKNGVYIFDQSVINEDGSISKTPCTLKLTSKERETLSNALNSVYEKLHEATHIMAKRTMGPDWQKKKKFDSYRKDRFDGNLDEEEEIKVEDDEEEEETDDEEEE